jgi:hypothetical protein
VSHALGACRASRTHKTWTNRSLALPCSP